MRNVYTFKIIVEVYVFLLLSCPRSVIISVIIFFWKIKGQSSYGKLGAAGVKNESENSCISLQQNFINKTIL